MFLICLSNRSRTRQDIWPRYFQPLPKLRPLVELPITVECSALALVLAISSAHDSVAIVLLRAHSTYGIRICWLGTPIEELHIWGWACWPVQ
jgi:hypothetical protein